MIYDAIIVGGGATGLTAGAFLCKHGHSVLICEKENRVGGLVGSFDHNGFVFDSGIRAMENSGVLFPMLKALGIDLEFLDNPVSIGIENIVVDIKNEKSLSDYKAMLIDLFPKEVTAIDNILKAVKKVMKYMDILYGIENPLFMDLKNDKEYLIHTLLPWMFKYIFTVGKIKKFNTPIEEYLAALTDDPVLVDMIAQHFFKSTPSFFALSYFSLYLDYMYPRGGTGSLIEALRSYIISHNGDIKLNTPITKINAALNQIITSDGAIYEYSYLIWCADSKALYNAVYSNGLSKKTIDHINKRKAFISDKHGGDSVLSLYLTTNIDPGFFSEIHSAHFFYTPKKEGVGMIYQRSIKDQNGDYTKDKVKIFNWLNGYLRSTTYEISIPCLRDPDLSPKGKTGLIISTLLDCSLMKHISDMGWYQESKNECIQIIIDILDGSIYHGLKKNVTNTIVSTPLTILNITGNTDGAITGWAFTNSKMPAVNKMIRISGSIKTPIPHVLQAGQWSYSPSGLPISFLTGKLASDYVNKKS